MWIAESFYGNNSVLSLLSTDELCRKIDEYVVIHCNSLKVNKVVSANFFPLEVIPAELNDNISNIRV